MEDEEQLFLGLDDRHELVADQVRQNVNLGEAGMVPVAVSDGQQKNHPEQEYCDNIKLQKNRSNGAP